MASSGSYDLTKKVSEHDVVNQGTYKSLEPGNLLRQMVQDVLPPPTEPVDELEAAEIEYLMSTQPSVSATQKETKGGTQRPAESNGIVSTDIFESLQESSVDDLEPESDLQGTSDQQLVNKEEEKLGSVSEIVVDPEVLTAVPLCRMSNMESQNTGPTTAGPGRVNESGKIPSASDGPEAEKEGMPVTKETTTTTEESTTSEDDGSLHYRKVTKVVEKTVKKSKIPISVTVSKSEMKRDPGDQEGQMMTEPKVERKTEREVEVEQIQKKTTMVVEAPPEMIARHFNPYEEPLESTITPIQVERKDLIDMEALNKITPADPGPENDLTHEAPPTEQVPPTEQAPGTEQAPTEEPAQHDTGKPAKQVFHIIQKEASPAKQDPADLSALISTPDRSASPNSLDDSGVLTNGNASTPINKSSLEGGSREGTPVEEEYIERKERQKPSFTMPSDFEPTGERQHPADLTIETLHPESPNSFAASPNSPGQDSQLSGASSSGVDSMPMSPLSASVSNVPMSPNASSISADVHRPHDLSSAIASRNSTCESVDSGRGSDPVRHPGHFVVVAIDFGTTFSGYAFSFTRDPESIHMMRKWEGGDPGVINQKTPTAILLHPDGRFHSFGFSARDFFHDLDPQESKKWMYFDRFKMMLHHDADLNQDTQLKASNGKSMRALTIFSYALRFFKEHALQELSDQSATKILNEDVRWVLTVPAIWKAPAKQFMREAAYEAGIANPDYPDQLLIALEPEVASIYCRRLRMHQLMPEVPVRQPLTLKRNSQLIQEEPMNMDLVGDSVIGGFVRPKLPLDVNESMSKLIQGTRYMVVDCGGGTVDITVHEMEEGTGVLKEMYKATGGPFGSVGVDIEFEKLLNNIFGSDFLEAFKIKRPAGYVDLMIAFESRKRAACPFKSNHLNVSLPFSFIDYYKKYKGGRSTFPFSSQVETAIRKYGDREIRWSSQGFLRLSPEAMKRLFYPTIEKIRQAIGDVLNHPGVRDIKYMFLVGGFAESQILQQEIRREFGHILKVVIPQDVGLTILKGAVCFGMDPGVVHVRRSRLSYGVGVLNRFVKGKHPKSKRIAKDGQEWCTDVFDKFVVSDQPVALGNTILRCYTPARSDQKTSVINIYCTERDNVQFITDKGVKKCGQLVLDLTDERGQPLPKRREIQTRFVFGDTEIKASALDVATGKCVRASIDFLNR